MSAVGVRALMAFREFLMSFSRYIVLPSPFFCLRNGNLIPITGFIGGNPQVSLAITVCYAEAGPMSVIGGKADISRTAPQFGGLHDTHCVVVRRYRKRRRKCLENQRVAHV